MTVHCDQKNQKRLISDGFVVIDNFIVGSMLEDLRVEFEKLTAGCVVSEKAQNGFQHSVRSDDLNGAHYPVLTSVARSEDLTALSKFFFNFWLENETSSTGAFEKIDFERNMLTGKSNNSNYHYDRIPALKVQIYLNDVDQKNGAMSVVKGSHLACRKIARMMLSENPNPLFLRNYLDSEENPRDGVSIEAKAGTAIVFDTMLLHKGGEIREGFRDTLRLVNYVPRLRDRYFGNDMQQSAGSFDIGDFHHPFAHEDKARVNPRFIYEVC